jgi:hypothetical protein
LIDPEAKYDSFGDTTELSAADAGGYKLTGEYYVDGQVRKETQNGQTNTYWIDPSGRVRKVVGEGTTKLTTINHFGGSGEALTWKDEGSGKYTRMIPGIGATPVLQIHDLQGDIVGTASLSETEAKLLSTYNSTEFGVPINGAPSSKYSWLGSGGVSSELSSGTVVMGTVSYVPQLGRNLQTEAVTPPGMAVNGAEGMPYISQVSAWSIQAGEDQAKNDSKSYEAELQRAAEKEAQEKACEIGSICQEPEEEDPCETIEASGSAEFGGATVMSAWAKVKWCWTDGPHSHVESAHGAGRGELATNHWDVPWTFKFLRWEDHSRWEGADYIVERIAIFWGKLVFCGIDKDGTGPPVCPGGGWEITLTFVLEPGGKSTTGLSLNEPFVL